MRSVFSDLLMPIPGVSSRVISQILLLLTGMFQITYTQSPVEMSRFALCRPDYSVQQCILSCSWFMRKMYVWRSRQRTLSYTSARKIWIVCIGYPAEGAFPGCASKWNLAYRDGSKPVVAGQIPLANLPRSSLSLLQETWLWIPWFRLPNITGVYMQ